MADTTIYELSMSTADNDMNPFIKKEIIYILDQNQGSYGGNQVNFDTSTIANSGKWASFREAYFTIPVVMTYKSSANITASPPSPYSMGMKNGFWQLIDSFQVDYNGVNVVQQTPYLNVWASFNVLSSWSSDEMVKYGPSVGFWKDTSTSWQYSPTNVGVGAASPSGVGFSNNRAAQVQAPFVGEAYIGSSYNEGYIKRASAIGYTRFLGVALDLANASSIGQGYFGNDGGVDDARIWYWSFVAKIRLKDICPFFNELPLVKGAFFRMTLNVNTSTIVITSDGTAPPGTKLTLTSVSNAGRTCPFMVSSGLADNPNAAPFDEAASFTTRLIIGPSTAPAVNQAFSGCRLYCPLYQMDPSYEESYLQLHPQLTVAYDDLYNYVVPNQTGQVNALLTNGITNPKRLVVVPIYNSSANGDEKYSEIQTCYSTVPGTTSPLAAIQNFQVQLAGINCFQNQQQFDFDSFLSELSKTGINGGQISTISSGLISEQDFEFGYRYYICDLARRLPQDDAYPKSVQIIGNNVSGLALDLICFIQYQRVIRIRTSDGSLITE